MPTLINDDTNYTEEGLALEKRVYSFMEPLFKEYLLKGYKRHEIEYIVNDASTMSAVITSLNLRIGKPKASAS